MKSVFDPDILNEFKKRIESLQPQSPALWGKMKVEEMTKHCVLTNDMFTGKLPIKRVWIGKLFGRMALKTVLKDEKPFGKNSPTSAKLITTGQSGDLEQQKKEFIASMEELGAYTGTGIIHPFFGPLTREQVGWLAYKHTDHHLRQFGA